MTAGRGDSDGFLNRWSRRKLTDAPENEDPAPTPETPKIETSRAEDETEEELLQRLGLPDPDSMEKGDDFTKFLSAAVPERLRRRALRRLWRSNPALVVLDGLNEYDEDYTKGFVPPGTLKSAYKAGRGYFDKLAKEAEEASEPGPEVNAPESVAVKGEETESAEEEPRGAGADDPPGGSEIPMEEETEIAQADVADAPGPWAGPRRMTFRIPGED